MGRGGRVVGWAVSPQASTGPLPKKKNEQQPQRASLFGNITRWTPFEGHLCFCWM